MRRSWCRWLPVLVLVGLASSVQAREVAVSEWRPGLSGPGERVGFAWGGAGRDPGGLRIRVRSRGAGEVVYRFVSRLEILVVSSAAPGCFFVVGKPAEPASAMERVVERWSMFAVRSLPVTAGRLEGAAGTRMRRERIYRGTGLGDVRLLEADPEGRFLLLLCSHPGRPPALHKLDMNGFERVVVDLFDVPSLGEVRSMTALDHAVEGRIWLLDAVAERVLLRDPDGDGAFESHGALTLAEWSASYGRSRRGAEGTCDRPGGAQAGTETGRAR